MPKLGLRSCINKTGHLRYLLPLNRSFLMKEGVRFHDICDKPIFFDPFDSSFKNKNMLISGASGGGKSVFVNKLVHNLVENHPTMILDKGNSFGRLAIYHSGVHLKGGFNPLQFRNPIYLREFILSVIESNKIGKLEKGKLLKKIKAAMPNALTFDDLLDSLEEPFPDIKLYFEDVKDFFISKEIPPNNLLYVNIDDYPKEMTAPLIIWCLEYFKSVPVKEKILVFDECWSFLKNHASYIDECFRTLEKQAHYQLQFPRVE